MSGLLVCILFTNVLFSVQMLHSLMSVLHSLEHAHMGSACPSDLSHTHPRNYTERTGKCQRGETGAVFCCFRSVIIPVLMSTAGQLLRKHSSSNISLSPLI